ncbi:MAG: hypothetical protein IPH58_07655 [Sphingobacteriales bacterium]|jgi:hypothetical protein|nr:hypothetical protein [Sphingobacteriales bacterium]
MMLLDNGSFAQSFSGGDGTVGNPYQITSKAELLTVKDYPSMHYILMNDIDFAGLTGAVSSQPLADALMAMDTKYRICF